MSGSERLFRWSFNIFIFLMCAQLGLIITLKSAYRQAEKRMKKSEAQVGFQCGDFNGDESFWNLPENRFGSMSRCLDVDCPESLWMADTNQDVDVHVVSVEKARPTQWVDGSVDYGHFVQVDLQKTEKPYILVLVSQSLIQWNFQDKTAPVSYKRDLAQDASSDDLSVDKMTAVIQKEHWDFSEKNKLKEVIVLGPELIWLEGLDSTTKVTYFNKDQICAYPTAWEEINNPDNEFRRLFAALKEYTGYNITSFQGRSVGRQFSVPFRNPLALERARLSKTNAQRTLASFEDIGIQWKRDGNTLQPEKYTWEQSGKNHSMNLPGKTTQAFYEEGSQTVYLINNHQVGTWDEATRVFKPLHLPLKLPALYWPTAMTFNSLTSELLVFNDDRGGEIYAFNVVTREWREFATKVGYGVMALHFNSESENLVGVKHFASKLEKIVRFDKKGQRLPDQSMERPVDFSKRFWRAELTSQNNELWLKVAHPAHPGGDLYPVSRPN